MIFHWCDEYREEIEELTKAGQIVSYANTLIWTENIAGLIKPATKNRC